MRGRGGEEGGSQDREAENFPALPRTHRHLGVLLPRHPAHLWANLSHLAFQTGITRKALGRGRETKPRQWVGSSRHLSP